MNSFLGLLLLASTLSLQFMNAQDNKKLDSLLKVYNSQKDDSTKVQTSIAIFEYYFTIQPKIAFNYAQEGKELAEKINYNYGLSKSHFLIGRYFSKTRIIDSANYYYKKALDGYSKLNKYHEIGIVKHAIGLIQLFNGEYDKALKTCNEQIANYSRNYLDSALLMRFYNLKANILMRQTDYIAGIENALTAYKINKKLKDSTHMIRVLRSLSDLYHYSGNDKKTYEYDLKNLSLARKMGNKTDLAVALNNIGNSLYVVNKPKEALPYFEESLPLCVEIEDFSLFSVTSYNLGKTLVDLGQIDKGIKYLHKALEVAVTKSKTPLYEVWALNGLGRAYNKINKPEKALNFLNKAILIADSIGNKDDEFEAYKHRSKSYELLGQNGKALADYKTYKKINDSVYNIAKTKEIEGLTIKFETEKKEQQIVLQKKEINLLEQKAEISNLQRILLGVAFLLSLIGFYALRQKLKRNKLEKEKLDLELDFKKKELTTHALHLAKKNEVLEGLKQKAEELKTAENGQNGYQQLIRTINFDLQDDNNWKNFSKYFQEVHKDFNSKAQQKYPEITSNDLRLMALLKMNLSSKEIANILNISVPGIKKARNRLRKKLGITPKDSLEALIISI